MHPPDDFPPVPQKSLWRNHAFVIFWIGQTVSLLGTGAAFVALPFLVLQTTHAVALMGLVTALIAAGSLIAGLVAGVLADRFDRRRMMLGFDALSALLYGAIPLCWWLVGPQPALLFLAAAPLGFASIAATVAGTASIPRLADSEQLVAANAGMQASNAVAFVLGPIVAGPLIGLIQAQNVLAINAASYLVSVASLAVIRLRPAAAVAEAEAQNTSPLRDLLAGIRFLFQQPSVGWIAAFRLGAFFVLSGVFDLLLFHVKQELHLTNLSVGLLWGLGGLGAIVGGLLAPFLRRWWGFGVPFLGGLALQGLCLLAIGSVTSLVPLVFLGVGITLGDILIQILAATLQQALTPDRLLGRVTSAIQTGVWLGGALGAAVSTWLASIIGSTPPVFFLLGVVMLGFAVLGLFTPARLRAPEHVGSSKPSSAIE